MRRLSLTFIGMLSLGVAAVPALAGESVPPLTDDPGKLVKELNPEAPPPKVTRHGVIRRPGQIQTFSFFTASGLNRYAVCPSRSLDVVMGIRVRGLGTRIVNRAGRGRCETFSFRAPRSLPVKVAIAGAHGTTGAWGFAALP
jgi:hypothetical protein